MARILLGGFTAHLRDLLKRKLGEYPISRVGSGADIREELEGGSVALLILDQEIDQASGVLEEIRRDARWDALPILYCLSGSGGSSPKLESRVSGILLPPLDPHELARQAAGLIGISLSPPAENENRKVQEVLDEARVRFLGVILERIETIEEAGVAWLEGRLPPDLREAARREAHKLAGLLGTLGFGSGSRFAREIEEVLESGTLSRRAGAMRYSELAVALRLEVEKSGMPAAGQQPANQARLTTLLLIDHDDEFAERLEAEALNRGMRVLRASGLEAAFNLISDAPPDVVLADLLVSGKEEEGLIFLERLAARMPPVPAIVLTSKDTFTDRVEVARRGGRGFLSRTSSASQTLEAALTLVDRLHAGDTKVLAVDDDLQVLSLLVSLLEPKGIAMRTLGDPLQFWKILETFSPDLLILDVDMPLLNGLELCRVVRNDTKLADTPIIFLTGYKDAETIQRVFASGADDFVAKPIVGPELLTRIFNRLERVRSRRSLSEADLLTGALNRRKSSQMMEDFLCLSKRHEQPFSLAVFEVEDLKGINANYGRPAVDAALQRAAQLLRQAFRSEEVFARWGGDEFVVGMYGLTRYDGVERLAELLDRVHRETFNSGSGAEFHLKLSAGVAQYPDDGANLEELYESAGAARSQARSAGGGRAVPVGWIPGERDAAKNVEVTLVMRDEAQASLLLHTLEDRGYRVRWLPDGAAAAKLLAGRQPALQSKVILIEANLPGVDGISLLKQLASDGVLQTTRVIMLTSPSVSNEAQAALESGACDYVTQPLNPPVAAQHIRRALDAG